MIFAILDNFIIMILALVCSFKAKSLPMIFILAGILMVLTTYTFFLGDEYDTEAQEKESVRFTARIPMVLKWLAAFAFSAFSGSFEGFLIFAIFNEAHLFINAFLGVILYVLYKAFEGLSTGREIAIVMIECTFIFASVLCISFVKCLVRRFQQRKWEENAKVQNANLNEMHEKRMNKQLVMQSYLADRNARLIERENISRNIHNSVGHSITAAIMTLDAADMLYDIKPEEARKRMNDANERIRGSLESIRRAVRTLDDEMSTISISDLKAAMDGIINDFVMDTEIVVNKIYDVPDVETVIVGSPEVVSSGTAGSGRTETESPSETVMPAEDAMGAAKPDRTETAVPDAEKDNTDGVPMGLQIPRGHMEFLTGVLEEMLTNGVKHGKATVFTVILTGDSAHIKLEVKDNGRSDFNDANSNARIEKGFGIKKIISYAERCGGKAVFINNEGFKGCVELPIQ
ncbi:Histidine kinase [Eubacterium ruminantium]|nr:Histidine kinase [Eubacterium ruminantium]